MLKAKSMVALGCAAALSLAMVGCSGGGEQPKSDESGAQAAEQQQTASAKDFDGSGCSDTGEGTMTLSTAGGTTEGGNIPQIAASGASMMQIGLDTDGMDGSVCTAYVDGMENTTLNAGERTQNSISLTGDALSAGTHTVELVKMDGDAVVIYKSAQYEAV